MSKNAALRRGFSWLGIAIIGTMFLGAGAAQASSSITRTSAWTYDPNSGLVTSETIQSNATSPSTCVTAGDNTCSVTTTYTYDSYGNKLTTTITGTSLPTPLNGSGTAVPARKTTTTYDSQGEFATQTTNALTQTESWVYDPRFGEPLSHTGPNGLTTTWGYDSLGRKVYQTLADGTFTEWAYDYFGNGVTNGEYIILDTPYSSASTQAAPSAIDTYDSLGRMIRHQVQSYNGVPSASTLTWSFTDTRYNSYGQVAQTSNPLFSGGTDVWTTFTYDALGRVLTQVKPYETSGSTTTYGYNGLTTTVTDAQGGVTSTTDNDRGLPLSVTDAAGNITTYAYDAVGDLTLVTDPAGNTTRYIYDVEGRKTQMMDPDRGTWNYAYDALGELISQTDANAEATTFTYDALGRTLVRTAPDELDEWIYDTSATGIGKIGVKAAFDLVTGGSNLFLQTYDSDGRPNVAGIYTASNSPLFTTATTYDTSSRISTVTYPSGFKVTDSYNAIGILSSVAGTPSGSSTSQTLWTLNTNSAAGQITQETLGNGIVVNNGYDPNTNQLLTTTAGLSTASQAGDSSASNVASFAYSYDNLGNFVGRTDYDADTPNIYTVPTTLSEMFAYTDKLYRLTKETLYSGVTKTFQYDALGDITYKSDTGNYSYTNTTHVHAISSISCAAGNSCQSLYDLNTPYTYDANGNQLTGDNYSTVWTSYNMALSVTQGSTNFSYTYDADHNRIIQATSAGVIYYLNDPNSAVRSELFTSSSGSLTWKDYLFAGGEMIGIHVTPPTGSQYNRFFIHDHLGSTAVVTGDIGCSGLVLGGPNSCLVERDSYDAWGKQRNAITWADDIHNTIQSGVTTRGFTGHEMVQNTTTGFELINMDARFYNPTTGRFMSTDPLIQDTTNLQDYNPYTYVLNNPLSGTDPTGMKCHGGFFGCALGGFLPQLLSIAAAITLQEWALPELEAVAAGADTAAGVAAAAADYGLENAVISGLAAGAIGSGGNLTDTVVGGLEAGAFYGVGTVTQGHMGDLGGVPGQSIGSWIEHDPGEVLANIAAHGFVGGLASANEGGSFQSGFLAAGFSDAAGLGLGAASSPGGFQYDNVVSESITGGIGSVLGGGKFGNGAVTGAFGYLFNEMGAYAQEKEAEAAAGCDYNGCWEYSQSSGDITNPQGQGIGQGYAGNGSGLNNPSQQGTPDSGPIPQGYYAIGPQQNNVTGNGVDLPNSMRLTPDSGTNTFGRGGFLIHGANNYIEENESEGCIVACPGIRNQIGNSNNDTLRVTP